MSQLWFQIYEARFGKRLSDTEVAVWEDEIAREVHNLGAEEIVEAVRRIAEDRRKVGEVGRKYAPNAENIITEIIRGKWARSNPAAQGSGHAILVPDRQVGNGHWKLVYEPESEWKSRLHGCDDPDLAWSIICEPCHAEQCREREDYANSHRVKFSSFIPRSGQQVRRLVKAVAA
jgi:hypothetical protein